METNHSFWNGFDTQTPGCYGLCCSGPGVWGGPVRETGLARSELCITTKYESNPVQQSIRSSLAKLGLKYVDLYLIHSPMAVGTDFESAWREFEKIKEDGLARSIGVSNYNLEQLQAIMKIARIPPAVNQIKLNPYNYAQNRALLEYSHKHGIVTEAYSSLTPITKYPGGPVNTPVKAAAKRRGATPDQIIMAWVRAKGAVIVTTSSKKTRLHEYLAAADIEPLSESEIAAIDEASARGPSGPISLQNVTKRVAICILCFALYRFYQFA
ncbi:NADP-dependent oxidoreductase domain-containing protein [Collybia nuda]|uniref:NADP-dependent oxidoreductase domain-containing protein n=1 Tax=Collybia nuda TaxID=64659 RepID=A0A9P6CKU2_9AGAR|nr:NADP-dependent oxidoreductase domain-containing protein [Collybia nuda]